MIPGKAFYELLVENGIDFFVGVPDSLLKDFCTYVADHVPKEKHIIAANEGGAVALAAGYHLATGKIGAVYMQNSGEGNAVNPLVSLTDQEVYSIPMLLLIGWRGYQTEKDEPQHKKQGKITQELLNVMGIPSAIIDATTSPAEITRVVSESVSSMKKKQMPYAILVRKGVFERYEPQQAEKSTYTMTREEALKTVLEHIDAQDIIVSTTGMASREIYEIREQQGKGHSSDFLTIGSMGHCSQVALGIAQAKPKRRVYCIDGDGAVIMHMGALAIIGTQQPKNFRHVVINNGAHESVGGQPTAGFKIDLATIAKGCGYKEAFTASKKEEIQGYMGLIKDKEGPLFMEIRVKKGHRKDLGRPAVSPQENKRRLMEFIKD